MLLDSTNFKGSDSAKSPPLKGDRFNNDDGGVGYVPGEQFRSTYQPANLDDDEVYQSSNLGRATKLDEADEYQSQNAGSSLDLDDADGYESQNSGRSIAEDFPNRAPLKERLPKSSWSALNQAKSIAGRKAAGAVSKQVFGDKNALSDSSNAGRDKVKELAKEKARKFAKDQIVKKIGNEGVKKGLEKGLSKGVGKVAKEVAGKAAAKTAAKVGAQAGGKAVTAGLQGAVGVGAAATGVETLGLGFVIGFLLNIAISLGVGDAVDALFELKGGDFKQARFLAIRAATKVGMFIVLLVSVVCIFSIAGIIFALPILIFLNIYMLLGLAFPRIAIFQGFVWWEQLFVVFLDFAFFILLMAFLAGIAWYICDQAGFTSGTSVVNTGLTVTAKVVDWWNGSNYTTTVADMCKSIKSF